jgi:hypothetical protein
MNKRKYYTEVLSELQPNQIFVFGSNLAGKHGKGAALAARQLFGAVYGEAQGRTGQCYAIPTKDRSVYQSLSLFSIQQYIYYFDLYAIQHPELEFLVTKVGCGLAGYKDEQIAPMFRNSPSNCLFHEDWRIHLERDINE